MQKAIWLEIDSKQTNIQHTKFVNFSFFYLQTKQRFYNIYDLMSFIFIVVFAKLYT